MSQFALLTSLLIAAPSLVSAACPQVHVFGARETTVSPGYGSSITVVDDILNGYPGSTAEPITYPACGGQASCGSISYAQSATEGVANSASQINTFNSECPDTFLVLVGYSQGGQIFDDAYCGGGDTNEGITSTAIPISVAAQAKIVAAIFMGDPRYIYGLSYEVGTCTAQGFAPRPAGFVCPYAANIKSYCDAPDPYCCNGDDATVHEGYGAEYGAQAYAFVQSKLNAAIAGSGTGGTTSTSSSPATTTTSTGSGGSGGSCSALYGQCGGVYWTGPTCCTSSTCTYDSAYYSQCL